MCDSCQETLKKNQLDNHTSRCRYAAFSCIDCYKTFKGLDYRTHTTCITEVEKYHKMPTKDSSKSKEELKGESKMASKQEEKPDVIKAIKTILEEKKKSGLSIKVIKKELAKKISKKEIKRFLEERISISLEKNSDDPKSERCISISLIKE